MTNPFELGPAIKFGLLFSAVLVIAKVAQHYFQDTGIYVASLVAGMTDVDAITLSMAELSGPGGDVLVPVAARAVVLAAISNTVVKGAIALTAGSVALRRALLPPFLAMLLVAGLAALLVV